MSKSKTRDPMDAVLANIEKSMAKASKGAKDASTKRNIFSRFGNIEFADVPVIPFGIEAINEASHCGGIPRGKMVELFGPESSGKSLLSLYLIASVQRQGLEAALFDIEQSFDPEWAAKHGVDVDKLVYSNEFESGEHALEYAYQFCRSAGFALVVIDSTAALIPKGELEGTLEKEARVGAQARMMSQACRKIVNGCAEGNTTCVFINQVREKVGVMYGNPETTPGGRALKFYSHQRIRVSKAGSIKVKEGKEDKIVGQRSQAVFVKNKTAAPFGKAYFEIVFDETALNPVVMLCNECRAQKMITIYKGLFNIHKKVYGKKIETGATTMVEVADFLIREGKVVSMLDRLIDLRDEDPDIENELDSAILELKEDASKIVSPTGNVTLKAEKAEDASADEIEAIEDEDGAEEGEPEEV